jgi:hypothetical protein
VSTGTFYILIAQNNRDIDMLLLLLLLILLINGKISRHFFEKKISAKFFSQNPSSDHSDGTEKERNTMNTSSITSEPTGFRVYLNQIFLAALCLLTFELLGSDIAINTLTIRI